MNTRDSYKGSDSQHRRQIKYQLIQFILLALLIQRIASRARGPLYPRQKRR
jgi:hypothetical protein